MEEKKNSRISQVVGGIGILVAVVLVGWFIFRQGGYFSDSSSHQATTTVEAGGVTFKIPPGSSATIEQVAIDDDGPMPDIDRPVVFPKSFSDEVKAVWTQKTQAYKADIAENPRSYEAWINIGLMWQMLNDFEGAKEAWIYATKLSPTSSIAFSNLGFLFGYHIHNVARAEANFKAALELDPTALYLYQQVFEFYRDVLKDSVKARALAEEGRRITGDSEFFDRLLNTL